jgi:hypothetical protein
MGAYFARDNPTGGRGNKMVTCRATLFVLGSVLIFGCALGHQGKRRRRNSEQSKALARENRYAAQ